MKKSPICFDKTAVFTQQRQNMWEIFSNFCGLFRKAGLYLRSCFSNGHSIFATFLDPFEGQWNLIKKMSTLSWNFTIIVTLLLKSRDGLSGLLCPQVYILPHFTHIPKFFLQAGKMYAHFSLSCEILCKEHNSAFSYTYFFYFSHTCLNM